MWLELRDMCVEHFKDDLNKINDINESIFSIPGRLRIIRYHSESANTSLSKAMSDLPLDQRDNILITELFYPFLSDDDKRKIPESESKLFPRFLDARFDGMAHLDSLITNLHMTADILSYLIFTIFPDIKYEDVSRVSIFSIVKRLEKEESTMYLSDLKKSLINLKDSRHFKYVSAYTNISKHRMLIKQKMTADVTDYVQINAFEFKGELYEKKYITNITGELHPELTDLILTVGVEINRAFKHFMSK